MYVMYALKLSKAKIEIDVSMKESEITLILEFELLS